MTLESLRQFVFLWFVSAPVTQCRLLAAEPSAAAVGALAAVFVGCAWLEAVAPRLRVQSWLVSGLGLATGLVGILWFMRTILCIATYLKGEAFLRECRAQGCRVLLLTADTLTDAAWPREAIDEIHTVRRDAEDAEFRRVVDAIARRHPIDALAALDDFDVEIAGMVSSVNS